MVTEMAIDGNKSNQLNCNGNCNRKVSLTITVTVTEMPITETFS